jgi:hypothetical protein
VKTVTDTQALSKLLFNAQHRVAVALVFAASDEVLGHEEVADRAKISRSVAHKELGVLVRIGALDRLEATRQVSYQRAASPFWAFVADLAART